ncbi:Sodium/solute symporter [Trinorchestia longiramus]|nr:Sodium/solute symporter [Trinorchestia longiramus]
MEARKNFGAVDYTMLALTVFASIAIGIYHGVKGNKTAEDFAVGNRSMKPLPVSLSLLATFLSANVILGYSGEVYGNGLGLVWSILGTSLAIIFAAEVVLPVLHPLKLVSPNQYLELRFGSRCLRRLSMTMILVSVLVFMGLALYAPTLALETVTPLSSTFYIWIMGITISIYASFGGLKAVVWADAFQMVLMTSGVVLIMIMSCMEVGGIRRVWDIAESAGRTHGLNLSVNPMTRHTVWNVTLLTLVNWGSHYSVSQANYQRVSSVASLKQAKRVLYYNLIGMIVFLSLVFFMSLSVFAVYADCDPLIQGLISSKDQISVYFVNDKLKRFTGIPGIFVAALLSAALSTLSSGVNTLATIVWGDLLSHTPYFREASEFVAATANKALTALLGAIIIGMAFLASIMGGLIQASYTVVGVMSGPILAVYLLGLAVPFCNKQGAISGLISGYAVSVWIALGSFLRNTAPLELLPSSTAGCPANWTVTRVLELANTSDTLMQASSSGFDALYSISYTFYPFIGFTACLTVGIVVSLVVGYQDPKLLGPELVLLSVRRFVQKVEEDSCSVHVISYKKNSSCENILALDKLPKKL